MDGYDDGMGLFEETEMGGIDEFDIEVLVEDYSDYISHKRYHTEYDHNAQRDSLLAQVDEFTDDREILDISVKTPTNENGWTRYEAWITYVPEDDA